MPLDFPSVHILGSRQFGGADQFYVRLIRALQEAGERPIAVHRMPSPVSTELAGDNIEKFSIPLANAWDVVSVWKIRKLVNRFQPCVVQTYMGRATRLTRFPKKSASVHIARLGGYYKIDGYYRHAHAWIGNTRGICDYLVKEGLPAHRVFHIGNFVPDALIFSEEERAVFRQKHGTHPDAWVLLALGRLIEKKGMEDLLHALSHLPKEIEGRPWVAWILGDGPLAEKLRRKSETLQLEKQVHWLGWQYPTDPFYAAADVFVCPSRHEPLGNVILEAWNYSLPVISTANEGALELIENDVTGCICPLADSMALAKRIVEVLSMHQDTLFALGKAGQNQIMERFSKRAIVQTYLNLYSMLIQSPT